MNRFIAMFLAFVFTLTLISCGDTGSQGPQGLQGIQGEPGKDGSSFLAGKDSPIDNTIGFAGDVYLDINTGQIWGPYTTETGWGTEPSGVLKCKCNKLFCGKGDHNEDGHLDNGNPQ